MPTHLFDAAVLGAGPAGSAAARLLSLWGHRVVLLSRAPKERSLAESLPPSCAKLMERLGLRAEVDAAGFIRATGNTVYWGEATGRVEEFSGGELGYQVDRNAFDELLRASAAAAGAHLLAGATARAVSRESGSFVDAVDSSEPWTVVYDANGEPRTLQARWILDCTGRAGLIARRGLRRPESDARTTALVGAWQRDDDWGLPDATHTVVESYDGGWAWSVPLRSSQRYVTVMVDPRVTSLPNRRQLGAAYHAELARTTALREIIAGARLLRAPWACDASSYTAERFTGAGFLLVGDAGSFVDPLSSFGVKKALASGWLAAVVAHTAMTDASMEGPALEFFEARERAMYEHLRRQTALLSRKAGAVHATDFWRGRLNDDIDYDDEELDVAALRTDPRVLAAFAELKRRPAVTFMLSPEARVVRRPFVNGNRLVLGDHLSTPALGDGARFLRNIDLVLLSRLASEWDQVPALFEAYNRSAPPAPLADFLGALSVLVGLDVLALA